MPYVYSNGSGTPPSYTYFLVNNKNQCASPLTFPSNCAVTKLLVYAEGYYSTVSTRLALWNAGGSVKVQSATWSMSSGTASVGGQAWQERNVSSTYLASGTYWVGLYRNPATGHIMGTTSSGTTGYVKTNTASFPSIASMSGYISDDKRMYVGAFYITAPNTPTGLTVSRNSDTSQTIEWNRTADENQPISGFKVYRYDNITGSYYWKTTITGTWTNNGSNSYTDTTTRSNRYYKYKVYAYNDAGNSSYSNEDTINTTPTEPSSVIATRVSGNVEVEWNDNATTDEYYKVQRNTSSDNITWAGYSILTSTHPANSEAYTDTSPANYNQYKISCTCSNPSLESAEVESNVVVILQPPDAPTLLTPDVEVYDASDAKVFSWQHNPNDGSAQTKFSLQYKIVGAGSWTGLYTGEITSNNYISIPGSTFSNGNDYEWQVKTWGDATTGGTYSDGSSDWSTTATFTATTRPTATITDPTAVSNYEYSTLTVTWSYSQGESNNQTQYICKLYDSSDNLLESSGTVTDVVASGSSGSHLFTYILSNTTTYKATVQVKESSGLWSEETEVEFDTEFLQPTKPSLELTFNNNNASMSVDITNPDVVTVYNPEATQDSYVYNYTGYTDTNYDGEGELNLYYGNGSDYQGICLDFDLSFFVGKTIVSAQLVLYRKSAFSGDMQSEVHYINDTWNETTVTFNNLSAKIDGTGYGSHSHSAGDTETWDISDLLDDIADETITDYEGMYILPGGTGYPTDEFYDRSITDYEPYIVIEIEPENAETDHNILYRSINGGDFEEVLSNIPKNTTVIDYIPTIGGNNNYYVEAVSAAPSSNSSDEVDIDVLLTGYYYINAGSGFESYVGFIGNNKINESYNKDVTLNRYEGRTHPVKYYGTQIDQSISFSSDLLNELKNDVKTLIEATGEKVFRDFNGNWFYCEITGNSFDKVSNTSYQFSCTITRVEGE
jgi:hypothetical protein